MKQEEKKASPKEIKAVVDGVMDLSIYESHNSKPVEEKPLIEKIVENIMLQD